MPDEPLLRGTRAAPQPAPPGPHRSSAASAEGRVLPFRPRDPVVRRKLRRHPVARWGRPFLGALLIVGAPCAVVWWLLTSPRLAASELLVTAGARVPESWVRHTLDRHLGRNLLLLPLEEVAAELEGHPWVEAAHLTKELPRTLRVEIRERQPAAILRRDDRLVLVDETARQIESLESASALAPPELPLVSGRAGTSADAVELAAAIALARRLEAEGWADLEEATVSEVEALGDGDFRIWLEEQDFPVLLRGDALGARRDELRQLMPEARRHLVVVAVDLRFEDRIIIRTGSEVALPVDEEKG